MGKALSAEDVEEIKKKSEAALKEAKASAGKKKEAATKGANANDATNGSSTTKEDKKVVKDPNKPKAPAGGAFGCFLEKNRTALMNELNGQPITAVTKLASAKW